MLIRKFLLAIEIGMNKLKSLLLKLKIFCTLESCKKSGYLSIQMRQNRRWTGIEGASYESDSKEHCIFVNLAKVIFGLLLAKIKSACEKLRNILSAQQSAMVL